MATAKKLNFEQSITELEEIVHRLEEGDLPLDEALKSFERGVKLSGDCQKLLDNAQQKVAVLLKNAAGEAEETPMEPLQ